MTNEDFVTYKTAQALKKMGFDYPCYFYYTKEDAPDGCVWHTTSEEAPIDYNRSVYAGCSMPTLAQAQKWLREKKGVEVVVEPRYSNNKRIGYDWCVYDDCSGDYALRAPLPFSNSYESALSAGIEAALKLITDKIEDDEEKNIG